MKNYPEQNKSQEELTDEVVDEVDEEETFLLESYEISEDCVTQLENETSKQISGEESDDEINLVDENDSDLE